MLVAKTFLAKYFLHNVYYYYSLHFNVVVDITYLVERRKIAK